MGYDKYLFDVLPIPYSGTEFKPPNIRGFLDFVTHEIVIFDDDLGIELFRVNGAAGTILQSVTYAQLTTMIADNALVAGRQYRITDFRTRHVIPNTVVVNTGPIEPIIVKAVTTNTISPNANSTVHTKDELLYEVVDSTTAGGDRGRIYYRKATSINVSAWYDWRVVQFRRWETAPASGIFTVLTDNGGAFQDFYTFNNDPGAVETFQSSIGPITGAGIAFFGAPTDRLNNIVITTAVGFGGAIVNSNFADDCFNSSIMTDDGAFAQNNIGIGFFNNTILGKIILGNTIGLGFFNNQIGEDFAQNNIGDFFQDNVIGGSFQNNVIGTNFSLNTIGNNFRVNQIGNFYLANIIGNDMTRNHIADSFSSNSIGDGFSKCIIGDDFSSNTILNSFENNFIKSKFQNNINIQDNFNGNNIESGLSGLDFAASTFVYGFYSKNIFRRNDGVYRLSFVDNTDTVNYVAPDA